MQILYMTKIKVWVMMKFTYFSSNRFDCKQRLPQVLILEDIEWLWNVMWKPSFITKTKLKE